MRRFLPLALLGSVVLTACDSQRVHDLYAGADAQAANVQANDTVLVTNIDASEQDASFIGQQHTYQLAPGKHTLIVEYAALFQIDADRHEKVKSSPIKVVFEAEAGKTYLFRHPLQKTVESAQAFAHSPTLELVELPDQRLVNASFEKSIPTRFLPSVRFENTEAYGFASDSAANAAPNANSPPASNTSPAQPTDTVAELKSSWHKATSEQRKAFLDWLKQQ